MAWWCGTKDRCITLEYGIGGQCIIPLFFEISMSWLRRPWIFKLWEWEKTVYPGNECILLPSRFFHSNHILKTFCISVITNITRPNYFGYIASHIICIYMDICYDIWCNITKISFLSSYICYFSEAKPLQDMICMVRYKGIYTKIIAICFDVPFDII